MVITKKQFIELPVAHREQIIAALFEATQQSFQKKEVGVDIDVPAGYSVRVAAILACEEPDIIVKKIFVIQQDSNEFIEAPDVDELSTYVAELDKTPVFDSNRDDVWVITSQKVPVEAYRNEEEGARSKIVFTDVDKLIGGIEEHYDKDEKLRHVMQHYGFVKDKDKESY